MRLKLGAVLCCAVLCCAVLWSSNLTFADGDEGVAYRTQNGAANTVWMNGLIEDYRNGRATVASTLQELWAERPEAMAELYNVYGDFNACFQTDLIALESDGPVGESNGQLFWFDESQFLDSSGTVIAGYEKIYNTTVRANSILRAIWDQYGSLGCQMTTAPNNKCCVYDPTSGREVCVAKKLKNCNKTVPTSQFCNAGSNPCN